MILSGPIRERLPHLTTIQPRAMKTLLQTANHPLPPPPPPPKKKKINKIRLFASPSLVFHTKLTYQNSNAKKHSIWKVIKLLPPVSASTKICNFHVLTDSEHKFHKEGIEDWSPMGFYVQCSWLGIHWVGFQLLGT